MIGEDLGHKPSVVEQAKFEYSSLGKVFNKELDKNDQKEGLFKRLKNIEDKNEERLKAIEDQGKKQLDAIKNIETSSKPLKSISFFDQIDQEAKKKVYEKIKKERKDIDPEKRVCVKDNKTILNFNIFKISTDLASNIYHKKTSLKNAENTQLEMKTLLNKIKKYAPRNQR